MFYYLEGKVAHMEQNLAVVDCGGVGYACRTSQTTLSQLKEGASARLYTHLYVREDICELYGFYDREERSCFQQLIGISGVGPKAAVSILSVAPFQKLALSIITGDEKILTQAPGIGKKIAQRIVLELRDKLSKEQLQSAGKTPQSMVAAAIVSGGKESVQEAISALMVLGYSQAEALGAIENIDVTAMSSEEIIRSALKKLVRLG